jgi:glycosyltransferase involved in cell wall biosynthesis
MIFSVIVPFLNEEKYIQRCISSLLNQDFYKNQYELIFVDNGSTDASEEIVRRHPKILLLKEQESGAYFARNKGLKIAKGEIIAFTDADCEVSGDWLSRIYEGIKKTDAEIALGKCCFPRNSSIFLKMIEDYINARIEYIINKSPKRYYYGYTNNMAIKAEIFKKIGLFAELHRGADTEYVHRCILRIPASKIVYFPEMKIIHLDVTNFRTQLKQQYIYGLYRFIKRTDGYEPLQDKEKPTLLRMFNYCVKKKKYTFWQSSFILFLISIEKLAYIAGRAQGRFMSLFVTDSIMQ